jgi:hypothetical protein
MASAILNEISPFLSNFKIWDPFCGSGTFLLQSMLGITKFPIRISNYSEIFDIANIRIFQENGYFEFLEVLKSSEHTKIKELIENKDIFLIGNDKAPSEAKNLFENFENFFKNVKEEIKSEIHMDDIEKGTLVIDNKKISLNTIIIDSFSEAKELL